MKCKNILSLFLSVLFMLSLSTTAFAANSEEAVPTSMGTTINEFELMQKLAEESASTLRSSGYSTQEISQIQNYREVFKEHITGLDSLGDSALQKQGYTKTQINEIRNFGGTDSEMLRLSATMTLYSNPSKFTYDGNYSRGTLTYGWYWTGVPAYKMQDMVAISWNSWVVEKQSSLITYYKVTTGETYGTYSATYTQDGNGTEGSAHKFNVSKSDNYYYAKNGTGTFYICSDVHAKKDFYYYMEYGHTEVLIGISLSFSVTNAGGDASISFSTGTVAAAKDKGEYIFP